MIAENCGRIFYSKGRSIYATQQPNGWLAQLQVDGDRSQPWFYGTTALEAVNWAREYHGLRQARRFSGKRFFVAGNEPGLGDRRPDRGGSRNKPANRSRR